jgi:hypothetical protein
MTKGIISVAAMVLVLTATLTGQVSTITYFPERGNWQRRTPQQVGLDAERLQDAIRFAIANENPRPKDQALALAQGIGATEPFDALIGPTRERAALNGVIIRGGYVVAEWGDTNRVDMTQSVTKTFLSTVVGIAWQRGSSET